ncbi:splicing factor, suppressor of white-apricot homolog [Eurytemora carolleeae]|uniref:splicing factor, suppressor of white-apricot homolog n=1 Tax=Eurytemora carolleeae TaxID=1294199 RepID=UPI000C78F8DE|nr:splicing factor, suppressor of white-apricot homolog [Eurytemora carolleeae]|eukprot:XP_023342050.1 splicing factor, suppressor of white-apricot homolog [Eurytemora affinis]
MEIFMKAKQSNNPAFQFLNPQDPLHSFYRHLVLMLKTKQYIPDQPAEPVSSLVPQYSTLESTDIAPVIPTIQYKRDEDCSYAKLISRIKSVAPAPQPTQEEPSPPVLAPLPHLSHLSNLHGSTPPLTLSPPPLYLQPEPYPGMHPEQHPGMHPDQHAGMHPEQYPVMHPDLQAGDSVPSPPGEEDVPPGTEEPLSIPPPDLQTIIDKMASYVARNGRSFEEVVRIKDSVRFSFLFKGDKHHSYYIHKLNLYTTGNYDAKLAPEPLAFKVKKAEVKEPILPAPSALPIEESEDEDEKEEQEEDEGPPGDTDFPPPVLKAEPKIYEKEEEKLRAREEIKLKDKLAAAAREKMMIQAKEKAVQLERKRKAAVFLAQLAEKRTTVSSIEPIQSTDLEDGELPVGCWPPPAPPGPPQLVIPTLAGPVIQSISSDSDSESRRKRSSRKRKTGSRHRSRSRTRERKKRKYRSRSRSRSRHKKKEKRSRRKHRSRSRRSRSRSVSRTRRSRSRSIKRISRSRSVKGIDSDDSIEVVSQSSSHTKESTPNLEEAPRDLLKPALNQMTEDLRAKVRAMLGSS